jgi:hypothetical protein
MHDQNQKTQNPHIHRFKSLDRNDFDGLWQYLQFPSVHFPVKNEKLLTLRFGNQSLRVDSNIIRKAPLTQTRSKREESHSLHIIIIELSSAGKPWFKVGET